MDFDVILQDDEELIYKDGIEIDSDGLTIDGCGHTIDARGKARIFNLLNEDLTFTFKNLTFNVV